MRSISGRCRRSFSCSARLSTTSSTTWAGCTTSRRPATYTTTCRSRSLLYVYDISNDVENENYAAFIHADYQLTDAWGFTAGGRYTDAQTYFLGGQSDLNNFPVGVGNYPVNGTTITRYFPAIPDSQAWHIFDPTVGVQYHFNPDVMAYASWGKGFKAGGWTTRLSAVITSPTDPRDTSPSTRRPMSWA